MTTVVVKGVESHKVERMVQDYQAFHDDTKDGGKSRTESYTTMINQYYDLATDFYERGWGTSFHFAPRYFGENFYASLARHEHYLAYRMGITAESKVLDIGCGVGGPAREIARFTGCQVVGLNNNAYQIERAKTHTKNANLTDKVSFVKGDFMHLPFPDNYFDFVYQVEATAHAPDKVACYKEVMRVLKPGGIFGGFEWCLTDKYDPKNSEHRLVKKGIEEGDGLPDISTTQQVDQALRDAGWNIITTCDQAVNSDLVWYHALEPKYTPTNFQHTPVGKYLLNQFLKTLEFLRLAPKGTVGISNFLNTAAASLVRGGQLEIFTPMYFHLARKNLQ